MSRLTLLSSHYRQPLNFTDKALNNAQNILDKFYRILKKCEDVEINKKNINTPPVKVLEALGDDLNTSKAFAEINRIAKELSLETEYENKIKLKESLLASGILLGFFQKNPHIFVC